MQFAAQIEPLDGKLPRVTYRWDPETDILSVACKGAAKATGLTGTDRLMGLLFGVTRGVIIVMAGLIVLTEILPVKQDLWWQQSVMSCRFQVDNENARGGQLPRWIRPRDPKVRCAAPGPS